MALRIMHVVEALGVGGGVENGIGNLVAHMDPSRFEHVLCAVFDLGPQTERYLSDRCQVLSLEQKRGRGSTQIGALARVIRELRPAIVHSRNWGAIESVFAGRWARSCAVIHSEHGVEMNPDQEPQRRSCIRRVAFEMADRVFSVSSQLRDALVSRTGFPKRKIAVIRNGVDTGRFRADAALRLKAREQWGLGDGDFCIGSVGRLSHIKNYPTLLRAVEHFDHVCPSWRLLILGDGAERAALETQVSASNVLRDRVRFLGQESRVPEFLNAIDLYVLPSFTEGISNSLLEAMATGVPVVASCVGGNSEVVIEGESGLFFEAGAWGELADLLTRMYRDPVLRSQLSQAALKRVQSDFSLGSMVRQYEEMYTSITGDDATRRSTKALCRSKS